MSFVLTIDVFCDGNQCGEWIHGETGFSVTRNAAREIAKKGGWLVKGELAYCPRCKQNLMYQNIKGKDQKC